jgi:hypothetical protein
MLYNNRGKSIELQRRRKKREQVVKRPQKRLLIKISTSQLISANTVRTTRSLLVVINIELLTPELAPINQKILHNCIKIMKLLFTESSIMACLDCRCRCILNGLNCKTSSISLGKILKRWFWIIMLNSINSSWGILEWCRRIKDQMLKNVEGQTSVQNQVLYFHHQTVSAKIRLQWDKEDLLALSETPSIILVPSNLETAFWGMISVQCK